METKPKKRIRFVSSDEQIREPLLAPLFNDIVICDELITKDDSQFARRAFVRAAFAFNEGFLYWLKTGVCSRMVNSNRLTSVEEVAKYLLLTDEQYKPNGQGKLETEKSRIPFLNYCALVLRTAAECSGAEPSEIFSDNGWNEMRTSLEIRHRITHPKKPTDLEITEQELFSVSEAHRWLLNCLITINNAFSKNQ